MLMQFGTDKVYVKTYFGFLLFILPLFSYLNVNATFDCCLIESNILPLLFNNAVRLWH